MNTTAIRLLKELINGTTDAPLKDHLGIKEWQFNEHVRKLTQDGYIKKDGNMITLQNNTKTNLFIEISRKWDVERLLHDSNELIFSLITEPLTVNELSRNTGLSPSTIYRSISDFESIGVIKKEPDWDDIEKPIVPEKIQLDTINKKLVTFSQVIKTDLEKLYEPHADIIFNDNTHVLKKIQSGKITEGEPTAFSLFSDYELEYNSPYDYYIKQNTPLEIHDVLIHSVVAAYQEKDKQALIMSIIFYMKHKEKLDILKLRRIASLFNIVSIWLDIEGYLRKRELRNPELFLPWEEFINKAELYNIPPEKYTIPKPIPLLLEQINKHLSRELNIYIFGGENMRMKNLKASTKDCDVIVETKEDFELLKNILITKLDYDQIIKIKFPNEDLRLYPDEILVHPERSRIDLFTKKVMHDMSLSQSMRDKADFQNYGKLKVGLLRNEHVFLLKAVASREGDIQDMALLTQETTNQPKEFQHGSFDWEEVWKEILNQEHLNHVRNFTTDIFEQISLLKEQTGITAPFLDKLRLHVIARLIKSLLRGGKRPLNEIVNLLASGDISEKMVRNRIDALERERTIKKQSTGKEVLIYLDPIPVFHNSDWQINSQNLQLYLDWRFPLRMKSTELKIKKFAEELNSFNFQTIGELDDLVVKALDVLLIYEQDHFPTDKFKQVGAARICVRLNKPEIGNIEGYQVSELKKYQEILNDDKIEKEQVVTA